MKASMILPLAGLALAQSSAPSLQEALASQNSSLSVLNGLLQTQPDIVASLSQATNITLLAPSNDALNAFLQKPNITTRIAADPGLLVSLLRYHVLSGTFYASNFTDKPAFIPTLLTNTTYANVTGGQRVEAILQGGNATIFTALKENSTVITPNVNFTGGTIHVISSVLSVPQNISSTLQAANLTAAAGAIQQAGVGPVLSTLRDVTIFAPNNAAFNNIGNITANITNEALQSILQYHVVAGNVVYSSGLANTTLQAAGGQNFTLRQINGNWYVNSAKVVIPDVLVSNGVVHVIDNVLNPSNTTASPDPAASTQAPAFPSAGPGTGIPFTSGVPVPTGTPPPVATSANPGGVRSTTSSTQLAPAMRTGVVGAAALFGGVAVMVNL